MSLKMEETKFSKIFFEYRKKHDDAHMVFTSSHSSHGFFFKKNCRKLCAFGRNDFGQLGVGDCKSEEYIRFVPYFNKRSIKNIACGGNFTLFQLTNGDVYFCGRKNHPYAPHIYIPTKISLNFRIKYVFANYADAILIDEELKVYGLGSNSFGDLGIVDMHFNDKEKFIYVFCGYSSMFLISINGAIYHLNSDNLNSPYHLDNDEFNDSYIFYSMIIEYFNGKQIVHISCGIDHSVFLSAKNEVFVCGNNNLGQLGIGKPQIKVTRRRESIWRRLFKIFTCNMIVDYSMFNFEEEELSNNESINELTLLTTIPKNERVVWLKTGGHYTLFVTESNKIFFTGGYNGDKNGNNHGVEPVFIPKLFYEPNNKVKIIHIGNTYADVLYFTESGDVFGCFYCKHFPSVSGKAYTNVFLKKSKLRDLKDKKERFDYLIQMENFKMST
jgi:hypothetical protein